MLITVHNLLRWGPGLQPVAEKPRASESRGSNSELPLKPITIPTLRADKIRKTSMFHLNKTGTNATFALWNHRYTGCPPDFLTLSYNSLASYRMLLPLRCIPRQCRMTPEGSQGRHIDL